MHFLRESWQRGSALLSKRVGLKKISLERTWYLYDQPLTIDGLRVRGEVAEKRFVEPDQDYYGLRMTVPRGLTKEYWFDRLKVDVLKNPSLDEALKFANSTIKMMGLTFFYAESRNGEVLAFATDGKAKKSLIQMVLKDYDVVAMLGFGASAPEWVKTPNGIAKIKKIDAVSDKFVNQWGSALT